MAKTGPGAIGVTTPSGEKIADEICDCGHSIREHGGAGPLEGKGACSQCDCERYTWTRFVMEKD